MEYGPENNIFVGFLVQMKLLKFAFEINRPLALALFKIVFSFTELKKKRNLQIEIQSSFLFFWMFYYDSD